jgi:hypothetical protein
MVRLSMESSPLYRSLPARFLLIIALAVVPRAATSAQESWQLVADPSFHESVEQDTARPSTADPALANVKGEGYLVQWQGKTLARYLNKSGSKPVLAGITTPAGRCITRGYPITAIDSQGTDDHVHHRSLWIGHGQVNGVDFWSEEPHHGVQRHEKWITLQADDQQAVIETENTWVDELGKPQLSDHRTLTFTNHPLGLCIDVDFLLEATHGPVLFGDTKEGTFAIRVADPLRVDANQGGKIENSDRLTDADTWGKPARWVHYAGRIDGQEVGVAVLLHPSSYRGQTRWHVRTYGLFAANPFGEHEFVGKEQAGSGHGLGDRESMPLSYRLIVHDGGLDAKELDSAYDQYAAAPRR